MERIPLMSGRRCAARCLPIFLAGILLAAPGCGMLWNVTDRGQRILDMPGARPAKAVGAVGAALGSFVGLPFSALLLPTYPFEKVPDSQDFASSPERDIRMPIVLAPVEIGAGLGAWLFTLPFRLFRPSLGSPEAPSEWPPPREIDAGGQSPGIVDSR